jgi:hypothetical protein
MVSNAWACSSSSCLGSLCDIFTIFLIATSKIDLYFSSFRALTARAITYLKNSFPSGFHFGIESHTAAQVAS